VLASSVACTSSSVLTAMPAKPPTSRSSSTVVSSTRTVRPTTTKVLAAASIADTGPTKAEPRIDSFSVSSLFFAKKISASHLSRCWGSGAWLSFHRGF